MPLIPIISFDEFVKAVNDAIYANKDFSDDRDYRIKVGQIAKEFKEEKWGKRSKDIDSKTREWISDLISQFDGRWTDVKNLSFQRITDLINGKAGAIHAHAIHYRLHAELDLPRFAKRIDEFVFDGKTFEQFYGRCAFEKKHSEENQIKTMFAKVLTYPDAYQRGRKEFDEVKSALLLSNGSPNAVSVSICGAGGYGKSYLTQEICDDESIQKAFPGGIYWLQFGLLDNSNENGGGVGLAEAVDRMLDVQYDKSERPPLNWDYKDNDILKLVKILPGERVLLVADDLGTPQQSNWLSRVPAGVSVLMTTRRRNVAKQAAHEITIQRLAHETSYKLLTHGMMDISPDQQKRFQELVKGFGGWPLLLGLANGVFKQRVGDPKARIDWSLDQFEQFLADDEIDAWDIPEADEKAIGKRQKFVGFCIEAGLRAIHSRNNPDLLRKLAVFPADADIPFSVAIDYWAKIENKRISKSRGETLLRHFADFSFFSSFNENTQSLRLHDEILGYFRAQASEDQRRCLHGELLASMQEHCSSGWETLPFEHTYGWMQVLHHLEKADRSNEADDLRTDFHWLKAKLASVGASELRRSFALDVGRTDARLVGQAINLSITELSKRPKSFAHQLYGRLQYEKDPRLASLLQAAQSDYNYWPTPVNSHLLPIGAELLRFIGHQNVVASAAFDPNGDRVVTASADQTARLWSADTGMPIGKPLVGHHGPLNTAVFDLSGCRIVTASDDRTARVWDANTGAPIGKPLVGHHGPVNTAAFDPSGCKIVTASDDSTMRLWNAKTGSLIGRPIDAHNRSVRSANFDHSGLKIVTASCDKTARLWDVETRAPIGRPLVGHDHFIWSAVFDPSGRRVVTASYDMTARLWGAEMATAINRSLEVHEGSVSSVTFDPSGRRIVTASMDNTARLWDPETGLPIGRPLEGHGRWINSAVFDPSGRKVVTASADKTARLWDAQTGAPTGSPLEGHSGGIASAAFDPSGRKVVTASIDNTARLWDADTGAPIGKPLTGHTDWLNSAVFDPHGRRIVTASNDQTARLWNATTGAFIGRPLEGHRGRVNSAVFDPSGCRVVTASGDKTARLWDAHTGISVGRPLEGHGDWVRSAVFDPSGRKILTISNDCTARLWTAQTGEPIGQPFAGHTDWIQSAAFDSSGDRIVTASNDLTMRLWDTETCACLAVVDFDSFPLTVAWHQNYLAVGLFSGFLCLFRTARNT